jgi:hypothetical protein
MMNQIVITSISIIIAVTAIKVIHIMINTIIKIVITLKTKIEKEEAVIPEVEVEKDKIVATIIAKGIYYYFILF